MTNEKRNELLSKAIRMYPDGYTFVIEDQQYLIVTKTVIECVDTGIRYFKGLDF